MTPAAPRSIDAYLKQLGAALADQDPALVQDAAYDAEEYLRAEIAAHPDKSEADVLELIASTYGAPEEVAAAYRETEARVKAALHSPARPAVRAPGMPRRFFSVYSDARAYTSLFFMLLALASGIVYFTIAVTGIALSIGLAPLIIGIPFFLAFVGIVRVISLGEGRLIEAMTGERRHAQGQPHLDDAGLLHFDAAARHRLLRHRHCRLDGGTVLRARAARCRSAPLCLDRRLGRARLGGNGAGAHRHGHLWGSYSDHIDAHRARHWTRPCAGCKAVSSHARLKRLRIRRYTLRHACPCAAENLAPLGVSLGRTAQHRRLRCARPAASGVG